MGVPPAGMAGKVLPGKGASIGTDWRKSHRPVIPDTVRSGDFMAGSLHSVAARRSFGKEPVVDVKPVDGGDGDVRGHARPA